MNTPKFLLAENPIADKSDGRIFILHTQKPILIAEVFHLDSEDEANQMALKKNITVGAALDYDNEYIIFAAIWIEPFKIDIDKLASLMRRMADWYEAYLRWEDGQNA